MYIFFKNYNSVPLTISESQVAGIRSLQKAKKDDTFQLGGQEYRLNTIAFIGEKCHNEKCNRMQYHAHPFNETCEYTFSGNCSVCNLAMWQRDVEYSVWKKGRALCKEHFNPVTLFNSMQKTVSIPLPATISFGEDKSEMPELSFVKELKNEPTPNVKIFPAASPQEQESFLASHSIDDIPF